MGEAVAMCFFKFRRQRIRFNRDVFIYQRNSVINFDLQTNERVGRRKNSRYRIYIIAEKFYRNRFVWNLQGERAFRVARRI